MTIRSDRLLALSVLLFAFIAGGAAGVAADRAWLRTHATGWVIGDRRERRASKDAVEAETIPTPLEQLDLSPDQQRRLHTIAGRWRPQAARAVAAIRPVVAELENKMFADMLCVLSKDQQDKYMASLRLQEADSAMIDERFYLVRTKQCPAESAVEGAPR